MAEYRYTLKNFFKDWMLMIGMVVGAGLYLIYHDIPALHPAGPVLLSIAQWVQPVLLFIMLFLSFCKIEPSQMRPHKWMGWLLLVQTGTFLAIAATIIFSLHSDGALARRILEWRLPLEALMLCMICPTATACSVVTGKLGGNMAGVITYTVLINIVVAVAVPLVIPLMYPEGYTFFNSFARIISKTFPLLIMPCMCAWIVRYLAPKLHRRLVSHADLAFYIWSFSLTLAVLMSTRAIVSNEDSGRLMLRIALISLLSCIFQFSVGKAIGSKYNCRISSGQALGQKNTVLCIWMGYTFMDPIVSVTGGFYSIWHNVFNSWQLYRRRKELEQKNEVQTA